MVVDEEGLWIKRIEQGHLDPFRLLYDRHKTRIFSLCYRFMGNASDAEDQLQEIFLKILSQLGAFRGASSFGTWAYRLATNHLLNVRQRRRERWETHLDEAPEPVGMGTDVPLALALQAAINELPDGFRKVFILHDQEGLKHEEIAELLHISPATSRSQLARARLALREKLKPMLPCTEEVNA